MGFHENFQISLISRELWKFTYLIYNQLEFNFCFQLCCISFLNFEIKMPITFWHVFTRHRQNSKMCRILNTKYSVIFKVEKILKTKQIFRNFFQILSLIIFNYL